MTLELADEFEHSDVVVGGWDFDFRKILDSEDLDSSLKAVVAPSALVSSIYSLRAQNLKNFHIKI